MEGEVSKGGYGTYAKVFPDLNLHLRIESTNGFKINRTREGSWGYTRPMKEGEFGNGKYIR